MYEFETVQECIASRKHLNSCDEDGYCNLCGEQFNPDENLDYDIVIQPLDSADWKGYIAYAPQLGDSINGIALTKQEAVFKLENTLREIATWEIEEDRTLPTPIRMKFTGVNNEQS